MSSVLIERGGFRVGLAGVTAPFDSFFSDGLDLGVASVPVLDVVREQARELRAAGADLVVLLSHLGFDVAQEELDDRRLAPELNGVVDVVVGAHSHDLLPAGETIGGVLVAQAGSHAEDLGRIEVTEDGVTATVVPVPDDTSQHPAVVAAHTAAERDLGAHLDEPIGELPDGVGPEWIAEVLRRRMGADVGIVVPGQILSRPLHPGPLRRGELWESCESSANPAVVEMRGDQLRSLVERGRDPEFARTTPRPLRGRARGLLVVVGVDEIDPGRTYRVAGTDYELEAYGGYVAEEWGLQPRYHFPTIVREAIEEHLQRAE